MAGIIYQNIEQVVIAPGTGYIEKPFKISDLVTTLASFQAPH
jgi:hypothetical protein